MKESKEGNKLYLLGEIIIPYGFNTRNTLSSEIKGIYSIEEAALADMEILEESTIEDTTWIHKYWIQEEPIKTEPYFKFLKGNELNAK